LKILDAVGYKVDSEIEGKVLLDPACGSGGFLVRATNILVSKLKKRGFDTETILNKVQESIFGFEINPFACHLAETNLLFQVIDLIKETKSKKSDFELERFNIFQTDTLRNPENKELKLFEKYNSYWLEDAEIVKQIKLKNGKFSEGFDFVVGNPPYVTVKGIDIKTKDYFRKYYNSAKGRFNMFTLFIERGIQFLSQQKHLGYVVPQGLLTHHEYKYIRNYILETCAIDDITLLPYGTFESAVDTLVIIMHQEKNEKLRAKKEISISLHKKGTYVIVQNTFQDNPLKHFQIFITGSIDAIFTKMKKKSAPLNKFMEIQQGIIYSGLPKSKVFSNEPKSPLFKPVLDGRDIGRYELKWIVKQQNKYIEYSKKLHRPREERLFLAPEKLLMPRKTTQIVATYDDKQFYALNTAYIIIPREQNDSIKYVLALLNSKLFSWYYHKKWVGWQVVIPALNELPIRDITPELKKVFINLVDEILAVNKHIQINEQKHINFQIFIKDFHFPLGDLADISDVKIQLKEHVGIPKIIREGLKVFVNSESFIECSNEYLSEYIELYLLSIKNELRGKTKTEVVKLIQIPKSLDNVKDVLKKRKEILDAIATFKNKREEIDRKIDETVYNLYGLTSEEIEIIENFNKKE